IEQMNEDLRRNEMTHEIVLVNAYSTARRWWPGLCPAFKDKSVFGALNFPGDLTKEFSEIQIAAFTEAMKAFQQPELLLFDYDSNDPFKQEFDKLFLLPLLRVVHPELLSEIEKLRHSKLRTEIFCLGRSPF